MKVAAKTALPRSGRALIWGLLFALCLTGCSRSYGTIKNEEIHDFAPFAEPEEAILLYEEGQREINWINLRDGKPPQTAEPAPTALPEGVFHIPRTIDKTRCAELGDATLERSGIGGSIYLAYPDGRREELVKIRGARDGAFDGRYWPSYHFFTPSCQSVVFSHGFRLMLVNVETRQTHHLVDAVRAVMEQE